MLSFEVTVWEKAEHWYFHTEVEARTEKEAWAVAQKEWPRRHYSIREVREIFR
jgi:hypothetical protein